MSSAARVTVNGILNIPLYDQTINFLQGTGGTISANNFSINNGGTFSGQINATTSLNLTGALIQASTVDTKLNSIMIVPDSSRLIYTFLTGMGMVNTLGSTFVNNATVTGFMNFIGDFTNLGILRDSQSRIFSRSDCYRW